MDSGWLRQRLLQEHVEDCEQERWKSIVSRLQGLTQVDKSTTSVSRDLFWGANDGRACNAKDHWNQLGTSDGEQGQSRGWPSANLAEKALRGNVGAVRETAEYKEAMIPIGERRLAALCLALIGDSFVPSSVERRLVAGVRLPGRAAVASAKARIRAGEDVLGNEFCRLRNSLQRRSSGAVYTPPTIVNAIVAWAEDEGRAPARIVDPGAGSGRFLIAAAKVFPESQLIGVDVDPLATLMLRANAAALGWADRLAVKLADYREVSLDPIPGRTLFVGNPPYVRHHDIEPHWKGWFAKTAAQYAMKASRLAGLHVHFFLKTRELARPGDFGAFVTAAEWLDVNYGSVVRHMLADGLGGAAVHVLSPRAQVFENTLSTGVITCFRVGNRPQTLKVRLVESLGELSRLDKGKAMKWSVVTQSPRWSSLLSGHRDRKPSGFIELGELFRVHRGQVTGNNGIWTENRAMVGVPDRYLVPTVTRAREIIGAGEELSSCDALKRVLDLPVDLSALVPEERSAVERFLRWAKAQGAHLGYIAAHRRTWWSVKLRNPAPILCTYMARRAPVFTLNAAGARHLNIAHGLYPRQPMGADELSLVLAYLRTNSTTDGGRVYAGGLVKFEPRELERLHIPALERLHEQTAEALEAERAASRRRQSERHLSRRAG